MPRSPRTRDTVRIWYTADHTLKGLDAATRPPSPTDASVLALGAAAFAVLSSRHHP